MLRRLRRWFSMDRGMKLLVVEAYMYLGWARILKLLPFSRIAPSLGEQRMETPSLHSAAEETLLLRISKALATAGRYTFWESECLVMGIAAMRMLQRRGVSSTLYLGTAKDERGKLIAHAWLRSGDRYITGADKLHRYTVVQSFANYAGSYKSEGIKGHG
ncbi:lasso peptide biosynthesis B2 protein [Paenibacillus sp. JX-17]|uniref:Lasso peptide biosynthesis B2 protein n=1 Tax=Paenibacillus lacisoli TaxID=3064525 RepID=A0ABT9CF76_9BACL|nr:lasso peptide biosynthesis B2 protein [Paenibacillus sp. JX-17]MDO7907223.1 lasso peptide biosynthesis B2 protein [Paenibacillus sp. JX-17]